MKCLVITGSFTFKAVVQCHKKKKKNLSIHLADGVKASLKEFEIMDSGENTKGRRGTRFVHRDKPH